MTETNKVTTAPATAAKPGEFQAGNTASKKVTLDSFKKFLDRHSADLDALQTALSLVVVALPINASDKAGAVKALDRIGRSAGNIRKFLHDLTD